MGVITALRMKVSYESTPIATQPLRNQGFFNVLSFGDWQCFSLFPEEFLKMSQSIS